MIYAKSYIAETCSKRSGNLLELDDPDRTARDDGDHREAHRCGKRRRARAPSDFNAKLGSPSSVSFNEVVRPQQQ
jgi:hypothetical protein